MSRKFLANKRARYYELIWKYKARREVIRKRFGHSGPEYNKAVARINKKIKLWSRQIKKYDMISNKIMFLGNAVAMFMGINPKGLCKAGKDERAQRTLMLFYRKGIELGIEQKLLREYVGMKRILAPAEYRTKHFIAVKHRAEVKDEWDRFVKYYNEFPITGSDYLDLRKVVA